MQQSDFLKTGLEAVKAAEDIIKHYFQKNLAITVKSDHSPVTVADREAEQAVKKIIKQAFPEHNFLGEEFGASEKTSEYQWVLDPIDGTEHFVRGIPLFTTELALFKNNRPILGISNIPLTDELIYAEEGKGAWLGENRLKVSNTSTLKDAYVLSSSTKYFSRAQKLTQLGKLAEKTRGHRVFGISWSYGLVAQGQAEAMIEVTTKLWDIAASICIVTEAGGKVTDISGTNFSAERELSIIASNGFLHDKLVAAFNT